MHRRAGPSGSQQEPSPRTAPGPTEPAHLRLLRDGHRILIRPLLASDREELAAGYAELSPASRRSRFGSAPDRLTPAQLDELFDLDYDERFALAALAVDEPGEPGVGVARYARRRHDPTEAEVAVVVPDTHQRRGIASTLLWDLVDVARAHGITTFVATVMWENAEVLDALRRRGATVEPTEPGVAAVRMDLSRVERPAAT